MVASTDESRTNFLPPLAHCFDGQTRLLSWKSAHEALRNDKLRHESYGLQSFLEDETVIQKLGLCLEPVEIPNPKAKNEVETRTASINVTPSDSGLYDIKQIKEDVAWLSEQAKIGQLSALRIVVLEWQERPAARVLSGFTEEEEISLQQTLGSTLSASAARAATSWSDKSANALSAADQRRSRILRTWLAEHDGLLGVASVLEMLCASNDPKPPSGRSYGPQRKSQNKTSSWLSEVHRRVFDFRKKKVASTMGKDTLTQTVETIRRHLEAFEAGGGFTNDFTYGEQVDEEFRTCQLHCIVHLLQTFSVLVSSTPRFTPTSVVQEWFKLLEAYQFFQYIQLPSVILQNIISSSIQPLVCIVTLQILKLPHTLDCISNASDQKSLAVLDIGCQTQINKTFILAEQNNSMLAAPAMLCWVVMLKSLRGEVELTRRSSFSSDDSGSPTVTRQATTSGSATFSEALDCMSNMAVGEDPIEYFAKAAVDQLQVLQSIPTLSIYLHRIAGEAPSPSLGLHFRACLIELARQASVLANYGPEILECVFAILSPTSETLLDVNNEALDTNAFIADVFLHDSDILVPNLLGQARDRYPYEITPFLKLCQLLSSSITSHEDNIPLTTQSLMSIPRLTQQLPRDFSSWELIGEDESASCFKLTSNLVLFADRKRNLAGLERSANNRKALVSYGQRSADVYSLSPGTTGYVVSDSKPHIIMWEHAHSAFSYLGLILSTVPASSSRYDTSAANVVDKSVQADIIKLFALQISAACKAEGTSKTSLQASTLARQVLEEASNLLERDQDIVTIIELIFEDELTRSISRKWEESARSLDLLVACIDFLRAILLVVPEKTWSIITRSRLLNTDGRGHFRDIVVSLEVPRNTFIFLRACVDLYNDLVLDVIERSISRLASNTGVIQRFKDTVPPTSNVPQRTMSKTMLNFTRTVVDAFQNLGNWPINDPEERSKLNHSIVMAFQEAVLAVYGQDDTRPANEKITGALTPASEYILETFVTGEQSRFALVPLLRICATYLEDTLRSKSTLRQTLKTLNLLNSFLQIDAAKGMTTESLIHQQLLHSMPMLCRLFITSPPLQHQLNDLFTSITKNISKTESPVPALLGYLNPEVALNFLKSVNCLSGSLQASNIDMTFWSFFEAVISSQQRWIATYLLTGETPRSSLKNGTKNGNQEQANSLLHVALDRLSTIDDLQGEITFGMLSFISAAQNHWPWVSQSLRKHSKFLKASIDLVQNLELKSKENSSPQTVLHARELRAASIILDILAMYLHNMSQLGDISIIDLLKDQLPMWRQHSMMDPSYNTSLHQSLRRNIEAKFRGCQLSNFKNILVPSNAHDEMYYNVTFASQVLSFSPAWDDVRGGYKKELFAANYNLFLVESQIRAETSWKLLATELSKHMTIKNKLQKSLSYVAIEAMNANIISNIPDVISRDLLNSRVLFVFSIMQRLVAVKSTQPVMRSLLGNFWQLILQTGQDFEVAFTGPGVDQYRLMLKTLLLCLQPGTYMDMVESDETDGTSEKVLKHFPEAIASILNEITLEVIVKGFRNLATLLHEESNTVRMSDLALLTSILHTILQFRGVEQIHQRLYLTLSDNGSNIHRYALSLFSWSDRLTATDNDPMLGELSLSLLLELSSIPALASFLATEGVLADLSTAPLMNAFRQDTSIGPFDEPTRLYSIWARGILPLTLNVLLAAGESFVGEASAFLSNFSPQISRASSGLDAKGIPSSKDPAAGCITLSGACEAHTLSLLHLAITRFRASPNAAALGAIPDVPWDTTAVKDDLEIWVQGTRAALRERIVPMTEREAEMKKIKPTKDRPCGCENALEQAVLLELKGALRCLEG